MVCNKQNSELHFSDMKIRFLPNQHHSFVTKFSYQGNTVYYSLYNLYEIEEKQVHM